MRDLRTYNSYNAMKARCLSSKHKQSKDYFGRGITIHKSWLGKQGFLNFVQDMGTRPDNKQLDRIDNDKGYSPENCKWATPRENNNNRRNNRILEVFGKQYTMAELAREYNIPNTTLYNRLKRFGSVEKAITEPIDTKQSNNRRKAYGRT